ncbi:Alanine dehydrogenase [Candidatus Magnetomoraceae bacterium gMMP-15]
MKKKTLLINRKEIEDLFKMGDAIKAVENVFKLYGENKVQMPPKSYLIFDKGDLRCMPTYVPDLKAGGIKSVNVHIKNKNIPTVMATFVLTDPKDGFVISIMDATYITSLRTGAAGAVAAKYLARKDSKSLSFIGAGAQAYTQLDALMITMPNISEICVYDIDKNKSKKFADKAAKQYNIKATVSDSIEKAALMSDILVTITPVNNPLIMDHYIKEGTHINAIGADAEGKQELDPKILKRAKVVIDNWEQASHSGEINVGLEKGIITKADIFADIGEIVTKKKSGRDNDKQITVFDSTGLAIQDLACAIEVYNLFKDKDNAVYFDFLCL